LVVLQCAALVVLQCAALVVAGRTAVVVSEVHEEEVEAILLSAVVGMGQLGIVTLQRNVVVVVQRVFVVWAGGEVERSRPLTALVVMAGSERWWWSWWSGLCAGSGLTASASGGCCAG
jgi:hypothetical protein